MLSDYAPLLIYTVIVIGVVGLLLTLSNLLGPRKPYRSKLLPYESGIIPDTPARTRFAVRFYLTAMLFIIFDVEAVFFYPWAVVLRELGWGGVLAVLSFFVVLGVGYLYARARGALEWR